jgi:hypothetical protein
MRSALFSNAVRILLHVADGCVFHRMCIVAMVINQVDSWGLMLDCRLRTKASWRDKSSALFLNTIWKLLQAFGALFARNRATLCHSGFTSMRLLARNR